MALRLVVKMFFNWQKRQREVRKSLEESQKHLRNAAKHLARAAGGIHLTVSVKADTSGIDRIMRQIEDRAAEAVAAAAFDIEARAKRRAPVDTGTLRNSIYTRTYQAGRVPFVRDTELPIPRNRLEAYVGPSVKYGIYVEMGTWKTTAQPYLLPAVDEVRSHFADYFRSMFDE